MTTEPVVGPEVPMRIASLASLLLPLAACNIASEGERGELLFTPLACGNALLGCDFTDGIAAGGVLAVQISGQNGVSTAGLDLASTSPNVLAVIKIPDLNQRPTWQLTGGSAGSATLEAIDRDGHNVDFLDLTVLAPERLGLVELVGNAVGPTTEAGVDEAWTVNAAELVSFQAVPRNGARALIGRLPYVIVVPTGSPLLATEQPGSDRPTGYFYLQPPAGDHPFTFELDGNPAVAVDVMLHAR